MKKLLEQELDYFSTNVAVDLMVENFDGDVEHDEKVWLYYKIDIEYRSWGIKGINVYFDKPVKISYALVTFDNEGEEEKREERELELDLSNAQIDYVEGSSWVPGSIDVRIKQDGTIVYKAVSVYFVKPD